MRPGWVLPVIVASACVTLSPAGGRVAVFRAPLDAAPANRRMPSGCTLLLREPSVSMPELDLEGQKDPFRRERNEAGEAGANALLVLSRMTVSRHDSECPGSSPITDCPPSFGAWYDVVVERYACTDEALHGLHKMPESALEE
jgi:hypothetical protein